MLQACPRAAVPLRPALGLRQEPPLEPGDSPHGETRTVTSWPRFGFVSCNGSEFGHPPESPDLILSTYKNELQRKVKELAFKRPEESSRPSGGSLPRLPPLMDQHQCQLTLHLFVIAETGHGTWHLLWVNAVLKLAHPEGGEGCSGYFPWTGLTSW